MGVSLQVLQNRGVFFCTETKDFVKRKPIRRGPLFGLANWIMNLEQRGLVVGFHSYVFPH